MQPRVISNRSGAPRDSGCGVGCNSSQNDSVGETGNSLMKTALSRMLEFFVGHDRRENNNPVHRSYCVCGALKPEVERKDTLTLRCTYEAPSHRRARPFGMAFALAPYRQGMNWEESDALDRPAIDISQFLDLDAPLSKWQQVMSYELRKRQSVDNS